jgi:hypothetical protein
MTDEAFIQMLEGVMERPPMSMRQVSDLEAVLIADDSGLSPVADLASALALYEPTDNPGPQPVGYDGLRSAARAALHDLDQHSFCFHDHPLRGRP